MHTEIAYQGRTEVKNEAHREILYILFLLHVIWSIMGVDDAWDGELGLPLVLSCLLELYLAFLQEEVTHISSSVLLCVCVCVCV